MDRDADVHITLKARGKSARLLSEGELYDTTYAALAGEARRVYRRVDNDDLEWHVLTGAYSVVVKHDEEHDRLAVVTQMHQHPKYWDDDNYEPVEQIEVNDVLR